MIIFLVIEAVNLLDLLVATTNTRSEKQIEEQGEKSEKGKGEGNNVGPNAGFEVWCKLTLQERKTQVTFKTNNLIITQYKKNALWNQTFIM